MYFCCFFQIGSLQVESTMEISAVQHPFVRAINDSNVHAIMMNTGAKIIFPDLTDGNIQQIKRSRIYISGDINCVYNARQQLIVS
jgi:protein bicaudal C